MKRILFGLLCGLMAAGFCFAEEDIDFTVEGNTVIVINTGDDRSDVICSDSIRIINRSTSAMRFSVFGGEDMDSLIRLLANESINADDTELEKLKLRNYPVVCVSFSVNGMDSSEVEIEIEKVTCNRNDMYVYVSGFRKLENKADGSNTVLGRLYSDKESLISAFLEKGSYIKFINSREFIVFINKDMIQGIEIADKTINIASSCAFLGEFSWLYGSNKNESGTVYSFLIGKYSFSLDENSNLIIREK